MGWGGKRTTAFSAERDERGEERADFSLGIEDGDDGELPWIDGDDGASRLRT